MGGSGPDGLGLSPAILTYQLSLPNHKMGIIICLPDEVVGERSMRKHRETAPTMLLAVRSLTLLIRMLHVHSFIHSTFRRAPLLL